jgi:hypothetical protein
MFEFLPVAIEKRGLLGLAKYKYSAVDKASIGTHS